MHEVTQEGCWLPVIACLFLSGLFVGSLYVWRSKHDRNHPSTIKQRFCSVFVVILISPFILKLFITSSHFKKFTVLELLGFKLSGLFSAAVYPLFLTMVLFLGPLCTLDARPILRSFLSKDFWVQNITNLIWLRNIVVGPLAEEFTFRACMVPLMIQCLSPLQVIFVCSLFFGTAHIHHFVERYQAGDSLTSLIIRTLVQLVYTTLFGAYSAYVFLQTGHFIAPFLVHAFCNVMAFPDFSIIFTYANPKKNIMIFLYVTGVVLWYLLLPVLLNHTWYDNYVYYSEEKP